MPRAHQASLNCERWDPLLQLVICSPWICLPVKPPLLNGDFLLARQHVLYLTVTLCATTACTLTCDEAHKRQQAPAHALALALALALPLPLHLCPCLCLRRSPREEGRGQGLVRRAPGCHSQRIPHALVHHLHLSHAKLAPLLLALFVCTLTL
jgi:hypothetical protein